VFENRVLNGIFGLKRERREKLLTEELHNFYSSPNITRTMKSKRIRWAGYVASMIQI
jgi:hypothetical protein